MGKKKRGSIKELIYNLIKNNKKTIYILITYLILVLMVLILDPPFGLLVLFVYLRIGSLLPFFSKFHFVIMGLFILLMITLQKYSNKNRLFNWLYNTMFIIYLIISFVFFIFLVFFGSGEMFFG